MSLQWGLQRAMKDNVPAYLESTIDAAPLYEKEGFCREAVNDTGRHNQRWCTNSLRRHLLYI